MNLDDRFPSSAPLIRGALGLVGVLALAEIAVAGGLIDVGSIPRPSAILAETARLLTDREFLANVWVTIKGAALGLAIGIAVGVTVGGLV
ncbi:MAG: ABC transporter permease, partial [Acidimicrobiia bacterium]|nr:ABC transporter permease [Acidimicrobiia bacterium]